MKRQAFVFSKSSWDADLAQEYAEWVNDLLEKHPNAEFEFHQSLGSFLSQKEEIDWVQVFVLVIVTEP